MSQKAKVADGLPPDPDNPGWVKGWGVVRNNPWHLYAVCMTEGEAHQALREAGSEYEVTYGSHELGYDSFMSESFSVEP
ncbi:hypothetical protein NIES2135_26990 [Leptolyngbya boryana NIES-2135]|uniref:Uncharacterized protein n=1 Tax=Leptolyngbya boryana NIES-2135 TaxID=1973484 RepID=A0A1Z4JGI6_LEPBY|nr:MULTISPECIES: hypothetical protein [Leptolyngbya]BAY55874.1 hypothetical protein NIES2135_26990 [Leptolyngbya boryana NIES-2135]MBD2368821.1 hypothetical protein [Leptolyngbya sp. FACHB-161]MBD2375311.1 hypothetical protein [Leptolyngbya sp. FACHB-238]MBD2399729.1 hypothetical protein [Leptolyngbya sp. FACHB-239]MBD2405935.1 hypothetical protein [Leptolyngbya sp. FACHB-402]